MNVWICRWSNMSAYLQPLKQKQRPGSPANMQHSMEWNQVAVRLQML